MAATTALFGLATRRFFSPWLSAFADRRVCSRARDAILDMASGLRTAPPVAANSVGDSTDVEHKLLDIELTIGESALH